MTRTLKPEDRISHYRVVGPLGAGGMGEVYRARDQTLERDVALKILPPELVQSEERVRRFVLEAKSASSLNHPHIVTIYEIGQDRVRSGDGASEPDSSPLHFISMELVSGKTLAAKIHQEKTDLKTLLGWLAQAAEGLSKAHAAGIVHRDLKPGNIMVTQDGYAKVLDFGLAKLTERQVAGPDLTTASTVAAEHTSEGAVLGTVGYMAPEQVQGKPVDQRSDIFSFGAILYEAATRRRPFAAESNVETMHQILHQVPAPIEELNPEAPAELRRLIRRCLAKDPNQRVQSMKDVALELREFVDAYGPPTLSAGSGSGVVKAIPIREERRSVGVAQFVAATFVAVAAFTGGLWIARRPVAGGEPPAAMRFTITAPPGCSFSEAAGDVSISPDGHFIAVVGADSAGRSGLWVRALDDVATRFLPGTSGASYPFWSPDSRQLAFFAQGKLKRTGAGGGEIDVLCDAPDGRGGSWGRQGVIAYAPSSTGPLWRIDAERGGARPLTQLDSTLKEGSHRFPWFLPDGRHFLFLADMTVYVGSMGSTKRARILTTERAPIYVEPGYLILALEGRLVAQRFDASRLRLQGNPVRLVEQVPEARNAHDRVATASPSGVLVVPAPAEQSMRLALLDQRGVPVASAPAVPLPPGTFSGASLSPDGKRVALTRRMNREGRGEIWVVDLERAAATRVTFGQPTDRSPLWSPDGRRLVYQSNRSGQLNLYVKRFGAAGGDSLLYASPGWKDPTSWSPDGKIVVFDGLEKETSYDIWLLHLESGEAVPYLRTPADERQADVSPDGRWISYSSNESGRFEIYVQSFPKPGTKYQVTTTGAMWSAWAPDGRALLIGDADGFMKSVPVLHAEALEFGTPRVLFAPRNLSGLDLMPDGRRFIAVLPASPGASGTLQVVLNWTVAVRRKSGESR